MSRFSRSICSWLSIVDSAFDVIDDDQVGDDQEDSKQRDRHEQPRDGSLDTPEPFFYITVGRARTLTQGASVEDEKKQILLAMLEQCRQSDQLLQEAEDQLKAETVLSFSSQKTIDLPENIIAEARQYRTSAEKLYRDCLSGKVANGQVAGLLSKLEGQYELLIEHEKNAGDVRPIMMYRAEKEAQLKGLSIFAQLLERSAVKAAARGLFEGEWNQQVLTWAGQQPWPWVLEGYKATLTSLRADGPWPWPREEDAE